MVNCHMTLFLSPVRGIRGYLKQHEKQAVPSEVLDDYRTSRLSAHVQSPFIGPYTAAELAAANKYKYAFIAVVVNVRL